MAVGLLFAISGQSFALSQTFNFSGFTLPDDDSGIEPSVALEFGWDESCISNCTLRIDLTYHDSNSGAGLTSNAQGLSGALWDMDGGAVLRTAINQTGADVVAPTLVGAQSGTASGELTDVTIDGVSGEQVTAHWGVRNDATLVAPWLGTNLLSSVGDVTLSETVFSMGFLGNDALLPGGIESTVESNPPDGIPFAVVDPFTSMLTGVSGDVALAQGSTTAFLIYDGSLTDVSNVSALFGTNGNVVPEPSSAVLVGLGLVILGQRRRQLRRSRS